MKDLYVKGIEELLDKCDDIDMLDFVFQLLTKTI